MFRILSFDSHFNKKLLIIIQSLKLNPKTLNSLLNKKSNPKLSMIQNEKINYK